MLNILNKVSINSQILEQAENSNVRVSDYVSDVLSDHSNRLRIKKSLDFGFASKKFTTVNENFWNSIFK